MEGCEGGGRRNGSHREGESAYLCGNAVARCAARISLDGGILIQFRVSEANLEVRVGAGPRCARM